MKLNKDKKRILGVVLLFLAGSIFNIGFLALVDQSVREGVLPEDSRGLACGLIIVVQTLEVLAARNCLVEEEGRRDRGSKWK